MSTSTARVSPDELRKLFLFEALPESKLEWLSERGERRTYEAGSVVYREGEPASCFYSMLEGRIRLLRTVNGEDVLINETDHVGTYAGAMKSFIPGAEEAYFNSLVTVEASSFYQLDASLFSEFMHVHMPMAVHLLEGLYVGVRNSESVVRQREHLAKLGTLSASLAHELNNPAAAAGRATAQLRERVDGLRRGLAILAGPQVDPGALQRVFAAQESAVRLAKEAPPLSPLQRADLEDELGERIEDAGVDGAYDLAAVFVGAGLGTEWLEDALDGMTGKLAQKCLRWVADALETEALMDEIGRSTSAISELVAAVKQYSYMDSSAVQDVDVHAGLESTVIMLGHKLRAVEVLRDYADGLPHIPAYGAELNQVWTNLIDNAAQAMNGHGTLTLHTELDGDVVHVDVADTGPGIPEQVQPRVFDAFFTTKPQGQGSGLGLDNARRIVERRHNGSIGFTTGDSGTTFRVTLPVAQRLS
nr:ATP-binding protein [Motilibacter deserti]